VQTVALRFTLARLRVIHFWWPAAGAAQFILPTLSWATAGASFNLRLVAIVEGPGLLTRRSSMVCPIVKRLCALSPICSRLSAVLFPAVNSQEDSKHSPVLLGHQLQTWIQRLLGSSEEDLGSISVPLLLMPFRRGGTTPTGAPSSLVLAEFVTASCSHCAASLRSLVL